MTQVNDSIVNNKIEEQDNRIAMRLVMLRKRLEMSLDEMAYLTGVDEMELYEYEKCIEPVPASVLAIISAITGITIDYFFSDEEIEIVSFKSLPANEDEFLAILG